MKKFIINDFKNGKYWDIDTFLKLKQFINPNRNILEIGGHCGTSTILYASILNKPYKVYVYEPQKICSFSFNFLIAYFTCFFLIL